MGYKVHYEEAPNLGHDYAMWNLYLEQVLDSWLPLRRAPIYGRA